MDTYRFVSTGLPGLDRVIDGLRLGDNVVWQVDSVEDYRGVVEPYVAQARADERRIVYVRFAHHPPVLQDVTGVTVIELDPAEGFERFATAVHHLVAREGQRAFYVFDCLSDLLSHWHSDLMVMNFFRVTCPWLFDLDTVAYFAIIRNLHSFATIASIRHTTQVLFDLYLIDDKAYVHPLKVWERYSPTMYFPHRIVGDEAISITSSGASARLFASLNRGTEQQPDPWHVMLDRARDALFGMPDEQDAAKDLLLAMLIGREGPMVDLCRRHLNLADLLAIADREIGTGAVGGKSVGMLVARSVLESHAAGRFSDRFEPHDSFFLGADLFYTYLVANNWWRLWSQHKTTEGYFPAAAELREVITAGKFPTSVREQFMRMLEYFGQSPIIVRSSSLLEDNYGNAFAGKYDSVFCVNNGTPEERLQAFEDAVRTVYASAVSEDALNYRMNRNLVERDEQMAVLVQRVSGDYHGELFFPHAAGVANSSNLYVWDSDTDPSAGMARLVFGLGTRAVDRVHQDYARIVALDVPTRKPLVDHDDEARWSQHYVDVLHLIEGDHRTVPLAELVGTDIGASWSLLATPDYQMMRRFREQGRRPRQPPVVLDFAGLLSGDFPRYLRSALRTLEEAYAYPVDIEFTLNLAEDDTWRINLVQCRPLQTRGLGKAVAVPELPDNGACLFAAHGNFMGGNVRLPIRYVVAVRPGPYLAMGQQDRYAVAREIGLLNRLLKGEEFMLMGPGRWGTTTPSLGVPVRFTEVCNASVLCEFTYAEGNFLPELSYGSHFFQDLVETGVFYVALFEGQPGTRLNEQRLLERPNVLAEIDPGGVDLADTIHVARFDGLELYSDVVSQRLVCR